ncbi:hypothetical protein GCM10017673_03190 [Streptosporangium violaceochromogenes]|nr:hypothetical protein GCM10017673_03190 [Streptosporangium violaceochromogenes]
MPAIHPPFAAPSGPRKRAGTVTTVCSSAAVVMRHLLSPLRRLFSKMVVNRPADFTEAPEQAANQVREIREERDGGPPHT